MFSRLFINLGFKETKNRFFASMFVSEPIHVRLVLSGFRERSALLSTPSSPDRSALYWLVAARLISSCGFGLRAVDGGDGDKEYLAHSIDPAKDALRRIREQIMPEEAPDLAPPHM